MVKILRLLLIIGVVATLAFIAPFVIQTYYSKKEVKKIMISNETFYFKNIKRGLNYELTALSKSNKKRIDYDDKKSFIYTSGETLFYKIKSDSLIIYTTYKAQYPEQIKTNVVIQQNEITNPKFIELKNNYRKLGLLKFPE